MTTPVWPILSHYNQDHLRRISLPLSGIGTGTIGLGADGSLRDFEVGSRPAKGFCQSPISSEPTAHLTTSDQTATNRARARDSAAC